MSEYSFPRLHPTDTSVFVTWRLRGSLPAWVDASHYSTPGGAFFAQDRALDQSASGPRWLMLPQIANIVAAAIEQGASERGFYEISAWCVMPNHVHMLILPRVPLRVPIRWLKGSTARAANQILQRTGNAFWQDESFDHYVTNGDELRKIAEYIEKNPVAAGLVSKPEFWRWSSVGLAGHGPAH